MIEERFMKVGKVVVGDSTIETRTFPKECCNFTFSNGKYKYEYSESIDNNVLRSTELSFVIDEAPLTTNDIFKVRTTERNPVYNDGEFFGINISYFNFEKYVSYFICCSLNRITVHGVQSKGIVFDSELSEENLEKAFDEVLGLVVNTLPIDEEKKVVLKDIYWKNYPFVAELFKASLKVPVYFYETGSIALGERMTDTISKRNEDIKRLDLKLKNNTLMNDEYNKEKSMIISKSNVEINNASMLLEQLRLFVEKPASKRKGTK